MKLKNNGSRKKTLSINLFLFAGLFILVSINKKVFRPFFAGNPVTSVLTGCFPNFIAAFIITIALINSVLMKNIKESKKIVYVLSIVVFVIFTVEELTGIIGASTYFDPYDILASGIGIVCAIVFYEYKRKKN